MNFYSIQHNYNLNTFRDDKNLNIKVGDTVIVKTTNCLEAGLIVSALGSEDKNLEKIKKNNDHNLDTIKIDDKNFMKYFFVIRKATEEDLNREKENRKIEQDVLEVTRELIKKYKTNMSLINVKVFFDSSKYLFNYIAEKRVDFRDLLKELTTRFKARIELRQIGIRDKSKLIGGYGVCGKEICCHNIKRPLDSITIKMVKNQNMPLNTMKISGLCGRLMCCIKYEYDSYLEIQKNLPRIRDIIRLDNKSWEVTNINVQTGNIWLKDREGTVKIASTRDKFKIEKTFNQKEKMDNYLNAEEEELEKLED